MSNIKQKERKMILEFSSPQSLGKVKPRVQLTPVRKIYSSLARNNKNRSFEQNNFDSDADSNRATCSSGYELNEPFSFFQSVKIKLFYYINNETETIDIVISEDKTIKEFIIFAIGEINERFNKENREIKLVIDDIERYSVRRVKKNGKANYELPVYNKGTTLQNCNEEKLALIWEDGEVSHIGERNEGAKRNSVNKKKDKEKEKHYKNVHLHQHTIKKYKYNHDFKNEDDKDMCVIL